MRVAVDEDICIGSGNCAQDCPAVFEIIDGKSHVKADPVPVLPGLTLLIVLPFIPVNSGASTPLGVYT